MYNKEAAFLTIKVDLAALALGPTADQKATGFAMFVECAQEEMRRMGAIRVNLILDVAQAVFDLDDASTAELFTRVVSIGANIEARFREKGHKSNRRWLWSGLAVGPVLFDDEILFGDAVVDSVKYSDAAHREDAFLVASSQLVPDSIGNYRLSSVGSKPVVVIKSLPALTNSGES